MSKRQDNECDSEMMRAILRTLELISKPYVFVPRGGLLGDGCARVVVQQFHEPTCPDCERLAAFPLTIDDDGVRVSKDPFADEPTTLPLGLETVEEALGALTAGLRALHCSPPVEDEDGDAWASATWEEP